MRSLLLAAATWAGPLVAALFALAVGAAVTGKSSSAGERAVVTLCALYLLLFVGGTVVLWRGLGAAHGARVWVVIPHLMLQLGTVLALAFTTAVAFNR